MARVKVMMLAMKPKKIKPQEARFNKALRLLEAGFAEKKITGKMGTANNKGKVARWSSKVILLAKTLIRLFSWPA